MEWIRRISDWEYTLSIQKKSNPLLLVCLVYLFANKIWRYSAKPTKTGQDSGDDLKLWHAVYKTPAFQKGLDSLITEKTNVC